VFKSVKLALVSLIPNVVPLLLGLATLSVLGWHLALVPAMILTLGLGLVVDDTIHLLVRYREHLGTGVGRGESIRRALVGAGEAVVVTSLLLLVGFGVNWTSDYPINHEFAMVGSTVVLTALFCDLLLLPALLTVLGAERAQKTI
jgi:predicted RND superfamily exporter protein